MKDRFAERFSGGAFVAAALMLWLGRFLLPARTGTYFVPCVVGRVHEHFHLWMWTCRIHLFRMITTVVVLFALASLVAESPYRVLRWLGVAVTSAA